MSASLALLASSVFLSGCSANFAAASAASTAVPLATIQGNVHGGRQPVTGSHIYIYAAGSAGYGSASTSLLTAFNTGAFPTTLDANNNYYVTSDAGGNFSLTGEYTCLANTQVYLYAIGGNPGLPVGQTNSAAGFLAALGNCPPSGTLALQVPYVSVNEVSTVAAAYALAGFASDATHIGSSGSVQASAGIANAFATAANLYDISGANLGRARTAPATSAGTVPQAEIHTLANALAACVNSTGSTSAQCSALFNNIKSAGSTGTTATDTASVAINIAHNPTTAISTIFNNPSGIGTPFLPTLATAPNDFTVEVSFYSGTLGFPSYIAIDAPGNVWVSCYSTSVSKYSPTGALLSGFSGYSGGGLNHGTYIAIDKTGNAWVANQSGGTVTEFAPNGTPLSGTGFAGNNDLDPAGIAIDSSNNVWVSNFGKNTISKLTNNGAEASGSPYSASGLNGPWGIAIDTLGNVWSGNQNINDIVELSSAGAVAGASPFTTGGYNTPRGIAVGAGSTEWVANYAVSSITRLNSSGVGTNITGGGLSNPSDIIVDGAGNVWTANHNNNSVSEFSAAGLAITPSTGYTSPDYNVPYGIAIDSAGNVWLTQANGDILSEIVGAAAPTITPTVSALAFIGSRP